VAHAAQMTNSCSPQPPKTSANWPRSFLHRSKRARPERKGARAVFNEHLSAIASGSFSTESAYCGRSLQVLGSCFDKAKAALHQSKYAAPVAAASTKGSNAQRAEFAKFGGCHQSGRWSETQRMNGCDP